jgi:hypothetical protein
MKYIILGVLLVLGFSDLFGQKFEFAAGANRNSFIDFHDKESHFVSRYNPKFGYSLGFSLYEIKIDTVKIKISMQLDNYYGSIYTYQRSLAGESETQAQVRKTDLGIELYPLNFKLGEKIQLYLGSEFRFRLSDHISGYKSSWRLGTQPTNMTIENDSVRITKNFAFGLSGGIGYFFRINRNFYLVPQYKFYFGLSDEFKNVEAKIKSMRQYLFLGIVKDIK